MLERIDVYGIDAPDLERVARVIEEKCGIAFDTKNDSEMGGVYYDYDPDPDGDEHWLLHKPNEDEGEDEDEGEPYVHYPIDLRIWDAPNMDEVRRKLAEIDEFVVVLESWKVTDGETGEVLEKHSPYDLFG